MGDHLTVALAREGVPAFDEVLAQLTVVEISPLRTAPMVPCSEVIGGSPVTRSMTAKRVCPITPGPTAKTPEASAPMLEQPQLVRNIPSRDVRAHSAGDPAHAARLTWQQCLWGAHDGCCNRGAGFIGSSLVNRLIELGESVRVLDNLSTGYADNVPSHVELVEGDVADEEAVRNAVAGADRVFHQAAARSVIGSVEHPLLTDTSNTHGTLNVLKAALDAGVRRVVYASSSSVYGGAAPLPTAETAPLVPRSPYAVSKLAGEHYCRVFSELYGLETVALRYFNVYGPGSVPTPLMPESSLCSSERS